MATELPVQSTLPLLRDALARHGTAVLQAPPGAGKTSLVPLALLGADWLADRSIVMLEPRRLAARAAAHRLAELHGGAVGETIGYRMRGDTRVSRATRIEVVTEGVLTRRIQRDPTLDDVGLLIFDEFHERSLDADLGLALALRTRALVRDDLRVLVMSATLDGARVSALLGDAPIVTSQGRVYPIDTRYLPPRAGARLETTVAAAVHHALRTDDGDLLVFLPGAGEIRRAHDALTGAAPGDGVIAPLYGALPYEQQDRALHPDPRGRRKIVLATSIAETSLTIEGIRVVIDAGWSRVPRFSPRSGMTRLETLRVSRASADQRRGRAGRLGPGVCYRLWNEHETHALLAAAPPEITTADLTPLALDLAAAGVEDPAELPWMDAPPSAAFTHARELLRALNAIDDAGAITPHGAQMAALPTHPRLAHMLLRARAAGGAATACDLAALLGERDVFRANGSAAGIDADIVSRIDVVRRGDRSSIPAGAELDRDAVRRVRAESDRLRRQLGASGDAGDAEDVSLGTLVSLAYPDRVAQNRAILKPEAEGSRSQAHRSRFLLRSGQGAELAASQALSPRPYIAVAELDERRPEARVFLAAAISLDEIRATFADQIVTEDAVAFDEATGTVVARRSERLGAIVLRETRVAHPDGAVIQRVLRDAIRRRGIGALPWSDDARRVRERLAFVAAHDAGWPDVSDDALAARLDEWLGPSLAGLHRWSDLSRVDLSDALRNLLDWRQRSVLDELAPTHIEVPTGSRIRVDYTDPRAPVLAVRIQEVFGLVASPTLLGGRVPVTMHLLSPARRPVQVTRDLAGFWRTSYFDVRKHLRGRYPKHDWPEDPLNATPTRRAKR
jgi:ATP-dependent helicase HrpB